MKKMALNLEKVRGHEVFNWLFLVVGLKEHTVLYITEIDQKGSFLKIESIIEKVKFWFNETW